MNKRIVYIGGIALSVIVGGVLLRGDLSSFLQWWLAILGIGLVFLPLTNLIFYKFNDRGYLFLNHRYSNYGLFYVAIFFSRNTKVYYACIFSFALGIAFKYINFDIRIKEGS